MFFDNLTSYFLYYSPEFVLRTLIRYMVTKRFQEEDHTYMVSPREYHEKKFLEYTSGENNDPCNLTSPKIAQILAGDSLKLNSGLWLDTDEYNISFEFGFREYVTHLNNFEDIADVYDMSELNFFTRFFAPLHPKVTFYVNEPYDNAPANVMFYNPDILYDAVVMLQDISAISNYQLFLNKVSRLLYPGGVCLIQMVNHHSYSMEFNPLSYGPSIYGKHLFDFFKVFDGTIYHLICSNLLQKITVPRMKLEKKVIYDGMDCVKTLNYFLSNLNCSDELDWLDFGKTRFSLIMLQEIIKDNMDGTSHQISPVIYLFRKETGLDTIHEEDEEVVSRDLDIDFLDDELEGENLYDEVD